jgi:hypothetical protein
MFHSLKIGTPFTRDEITVFQGQNTADLAWFRRGSNLGHTQGRVGAAWPADDTLIFSGAV